VIDDSTEEGAGTTGSRKFSRRLLIQRATVVAATAGLAGCGASERPQEVSGDVDARSLRVPPPTQAPMNCRVYSFFTPDEAATVDAFTARLIPGDAADPGAREACVVGYIDAKLAKYPGYATPTYARGPFAKPVPEAPPDGSPTREQILVSKDQLPLYGFQSKATAQESYRKGIASLDDFSRRRYGGRFVALSEDDQDAVLKALETANPSAPSVATKQADLANPVAALKAAKAKHERELQTPEQKLLAKLFTSPSAYGFFSMLQSDAHEGFLADPIYGGNRDFAGWKLVGYPGAQRAWTPYELTHGPRARTIQGLQQMPAMNPGVPQDHVVLPIHGTERTAQ
jgi:gluconate 2-dehydrogenase gamma chain